MKIFEGPRKAADVLILARTSNKLEKYTRDGGYDKLALKLEDRALNGKCDPLAAEAALNDYRADLSEDPNLTSKKERGAEALSRLVEAHVIDPVFAEDVLNRDFSRGVVIAALEHSAASRTIFS